MIIDRYRTFSKGYLMTPEFPGNNPLVQGVQLLKKPFVSSYDSTDMLASQVSTLKETIATSQGNIHLPPDISGKPSLFNDAQEYEFNFHAARIRAIVKGIVNPLENFTSGRLWITRPEYAKVLGYAQLFELFAGDTQLADAFADHLKDKVVLEIGAGRYGFIQPFDWMKRRIIIEPLAFRFKEEYAKYTHKDIYNNIELYSDKSETRLTQLKDEVDGFIYLHNCLDHMANPFASLANISSYAKKGCFLGLWSDLWHLSPPDAGHFNIVPTTSQFKSIIEQLGFRILYEFEYFNRPAVNIGLVAIKC